ncbi:MAG: hypothetical protein RIS94_1557 [Pseudomonadota bacterium]|jgi:LuxR family quorum-sensing system transcriptional regulator CciR
MVADALAVLIPALVQEVASVVDLDTALSEITRLLGFPYFALTHHVDLAQSNNHVIRLHNYPDHWALDYDSQALGLVDPVHRASYMTAIGFRWSQIPWLLPLTEGDRSILEQGKRQGLSDGFTVPVHVPGEARGSCSFATGSGEMPDTLTLLHAQVAGTYAFEAARRLWLRRGTSPEPLRPVLTDRQRECVLLLAQGKSDAEIATILGISRDTATAHVRAACQRYRIFKRQLLIPLTLFDGTLTFADVKPWRYPHFL